MKTDNVGEYRVFKYGEKTKKKHPVVVITADIKHKKLLKVEAHIEGEGESEPKIAEKHLKELKKDGIDVKKFYGDGAFSGDTNALFEYLEEIREYLRLGYDKWSAEKRYGMRWVVLKRSF